jgi:hypothetical protein
LSLFNAIDTLLFTNQESSGVGFDDFGGELELHSLDLTDKNQNTTTVIGQTRARY